MRPQTGLTVLYRSGDGNVAEISEPTMLERALEDSHGLLWADLLIRSSADAQILRDVFHFHPLTIEDCLSSELELAKIDDHDDYIFVVAHALREYDPGREPESLELDIYLGPNFVVSCHREPLVLIEELQERGRQNQQLLARGADWMLHSLLDAVVDANTLVVNSLEETIDEIEEKVLERADRSVLLRITMVKRSILRLRRAVALQRDVVGRLSRGAYPKLVRQETAIYFSDIYDHVRSAEHLVEALRDATEGALNAYFSAVSNRMNEVMKILGVAATIFLPLTVISGIYGMNFASNQFPAFGSSWGFAAVVGAMGAIAVSLLAYFRLRRWI